MAQKELTKEVEGEPLDQDNIKDILTVVPDTQDLRDNLYLPEPIQLKKEIEPPVKLDILDQAKEGACTGFGLAAVINLLFQRKNLDIKVSARMLYEMAKRFDEWEGESYSGSSCRGAIKGWFNMGVARDSFWPYNEKDIGKLTMDAVHDARSHALGAYYRLRFNIVDFHTALNKVGAIFCAANVHKGWINPTEGEIEMSDELLGGHAFALVGYNDRGFFVQNSWGKKWGNKGVALWLYEDWAKNVYDGWIVRLALPTPQIWDYRNNAGDQSTSSGLTKAAVVRSKIAGHFVHLDDGKFKKNGRYWSDLNDVNLTANLIETSSKYDHLLFWAHGGLNSPTASASRILALREVFKKNGIYPYHFMYDTGLIEEIKDVILGKKKESEKRTQGFSDWTDKFLESMARKPGRAIWREMKFGATLPFEEKMADGSQAIKVMAEAAAKNGRKLKIHVAGHSTGAIFMGNMLESFFKQIENISIETCSLMAPACSIDFFKQKYVPNLNTKDKIKQMTVYNLNDNAELDDNVALLYRKSLLYLVSRSFEEKNKENLLGIQKHVEAQKIKYSNMECVIADGTHNPRSQSKNHGGFDNDTATMNDILNRILKGNVIHPFTQKDLDY